MHTHFKCLASGFGLLVMPLLLVSCAVTSQENNNNEMNGERARATAHTNLGAAYFRERRYEIALEEFTIATQIDPSFSSAYNGLGLVQSALKEDAKAEVSFKKAVQLDPNNSESRNNYGGFLCARNQFDASIQEFLAAVKNPLYGTPDVAYANAGLCAGRKGDLVSAENYLAHALAINPLNTSAATQMASLQLKKNAPQAALRALEKPLQSTPTPEVLWLAVRAVHALGDSDAESNLALQLRRLYPNSEQVKLLQSGKFNG